MMKKLIFAAAALCLLLSVSSALAAGYVSVDEAHFPDANFWAYILQNLDGNRDGRLSSGEIDMVIQMDVSGMSIADLRGVEYFTLLNVLNCSRNLLTSLDISGMNSLIYLDCSYNQILDCSGNLISVLDVGGLTALTCLDCRTTG